MLQRRAKAPHPTSSYCHKRTYSQQVQNVWAAASWLHLTSHCPNTTSVTRTKKIKIRCLQTSSSTCSPVSNLLISAHSAAAPNSTPVFRHLSTQRHGHPLCSATLKGNLFNFTVQSVSARLGEVGTSIATRVVTKKQGRSNSRVKLRFRSLWHLPSINKQ